MSKELKGGIMSLVTHEFVKERTPEEPHKKRQGTQMK